MKTKMYIAGAALAIVGVLACGSGGESETVIDQKSGNVDMYQTEPGHVGTVMRYAYWLKLRDSAGKERWLEVSQPEWEKCLTVGKKYPDCTK